jgi:hypothetical protein
MMPAMQKKKGLGSKMQVLWKEVTGWEPVQGLMVRQKLLKRLALGLRQFRSLHPAAG